MKKLIVAGVLGLTALSVQAIEETKINMPFLDCTSQAEELIKKGTNVTKFNLLRNDGGFITWFFETKTHHYSVTCFNIGHDADQMHITKETQSEYKEKSAKLETEKKNKVSAIASQVGL